MAADLPEGVGLGRREPQGPRPRFVAIRLEVLDGPRARPVRVLTAVALPDREGGAAQIVGRVVRAEVAPVPEDRPVLHQTVLQEHLLPGPYVLTREHDGARWVGDPFGYRGLAAVRLVAHYPEHEEPEDEGEQRRLHPAL